VNSQRSGIAGPEYSFRVQTSKPNLNRIFAAAGKAGESAGEDKKCM